VTLRGRKKARSRGRPRGRSTARGKRSSGKRRKTRSRGGSHSLRAPALAVFAAGVLAGGALAVDGSPSEIASRLSTWELRIELPRTELPELPGLPELPDVGAPLREQRFAWRHVEFVGLEQISPETMLARIAPDRTVALIDVDTDALCEALSGHRRIAHCAALRLPPDRVVVDLTERQPVAIAASGEGVDAEGVRFPIGSEETADLPRISGAARPALGLVLAARQARVPLLRVAGGPRDEVVFVPAASGIRVRASGDPLAALAHWRRLEETGLARDHGAREVDLRFRGRAVLRDFGE